jgi:serine/threonine protein kinase
MTHEFICSSSCHNEPADSFFERAPYKHLRINEKSADQAVAQYVVKNFEDLLQSQAFQEVQEKAGTRTPMPQLRHSHVQLGRILGEGGFSDVFEVKKLISTDDNACSIQADRVAVKVLRRQVTVRPGLFAACANGLAKEGAILASLSHTNIIQMKAFSHGGLAAYANGRSDAFFIVLDRLHEMLEDRITDWSDVNSRLRLSIRHRRQKQQTFFRERLLVAAELSDAVSYLHRKNIIHRDIKPANIGFDAEGTLKIFDFDISRVLPKESYKDELFHLSVATGTQRYMSPECALTGQYNLKSDVYSFAILLHEMLSLELPYRDVPKAQHGEVVFWWGQRPKLHDSWPKDINMLLTSAWSDDIKSRPAMSRIHETILETIVALERPASKSRRIHLSSFKRAAAVNNRHSE